MRTLLSQGVAATVPNTGYSLRATNGYVELPAGSITATRPQIYTVEAWIKKATNSGFDTIVGLGTGGDDWAFGTTGTAFRMFNNGTTNAATATGAVGTNAWTHVGASRDNSGGDSRPTYYRGGALLSVGSATGGYPDTFGSTLRRLLGDGGTEPFDGWCTGIRIWDHVRSAAQMAADYNKLLAGDEPGLIMYAPLNETSGTQTRIYGSAFGGKTGTLVGTLAGTVLPTFALDAPAWVT